MSCPLPLFLSTHDTRIRIHIFTHPQHTSTHVVYSKVFDIIIWRLLYRLTKKKYNNNNNNKEPLLWQSTPIRLFTPITYVSRSSNNNNIMSIILSYCRFKLSRGAVFRTPAVTGATALSHTHVHVQQLSVVRHAYINCAKMPFLLVRNYISSIAPCINSTELFYTCWLHHAAIYFDELC